MIYHRPINLFWIFFFIFMVESCPKNQAKIESSHDFVNLMDIKSHFDRGTSTLILDVKLNNGLHAYGQGEPYGKPMRLEIVPKNNWIADGPPIVPKGKEKKFGRRETSVVIEGEFRISQKLKIGQGPGEAKFHFQLCSTTLCDRPRIQTIHF